MGIASSMTFKSCGLTFGKTGIGMVLGALGSLYRCHDSDFEDNNDGQVSLALYQTRLFASFSLTPSGFTSVDLDHETWIILFDNPLVAK